MTAEDAESRTYNLPTLGAQAAQLRGKMHRQIALARIERQLRRGTLSQAEKDDLADLMLQTLGPQTARQIKRQLDMGWEWVDGPIGITEAEKQRRTLAAQRDDARMRKAAAVKLNVKVKRLDGKTVTVQETENATMLRYFQSLPTGGSSVCYAASHYEEYFAQLTCCWFEANGGEDPYTFKPRKNSQDWVRQNEPRPITELLERLYGNATVPNTNPRSAPL
jgi:hypothetical protein